jgi:hypothetical protein
VFGLDGRIEGKVQHVHLAAQLFGVLGVEQPVGGEGGNQALALGGGQQTVNLPVQQGFAAGKVHHPHAQPLQVGQVPGHLVGGGVGEGRSQMSQKPQVALQR